MVAPAGAPTHKGSSRYPTIRRSEASDARTPNDGMIQNLNPDFNSLRLQTIMESIQRMTLEGSSLVALAHKGAEATNYVIAEWSTGNPRIELSVDNRSNDRVRRAQSEPASLASGNHRLADNDVRWLITQNHHLRETGHDRDDLRNVIEDRRCLRARSPTPPWRYLAGDVIPPGTGGFCALVAPLRQVRWPEKFNVGHIDKYDGSSNPKEFI
jgi:hypothetical protein